MLLGPLTSPLLAIVVVEVDATADTLSTLVVVVVAMTVEIGVAGSSEGQELSVPELAPPP